VNCAERKDLVLLHAFGQLDPAEESQLVSHLRDGCPRCLGELTAARTIAGHVALVVPPVAPSTAAKERLFERLNGRDKTPLRFTRRWPMAVTAALLAASVTAVAILIPARRGVEALRGELAAARDNAAALATRAAKAEATVRSLGARAQLVASLGSSGPQQGATGRLFRDASTGTWHIFVSHMAPTNPGRTYELWLITPDQKKLPAGTFDVGAEGDAALDVELPKDLGEVAVAAITEEPAGGVPQPTGAIQLVGKLGT
jgi:hypothetical protein